MKSLRLNNEGDLVMENGELQTISSKDELVQCVRQLLRINIGEWFLDPSMGFDQFSILGEKRINEEDIREALVYTIEQESRIDSIESINIEFDNRTRELHISFIAIAQGEEIEVQEVI